MNKRTLLLLRFFLFPFAAIFYVVVSVKNFLYNKNFFSVHRFQTPIINVGNIRVGGTGKTPFIFYLLNRLLKNARVGILSKGYKRKSKGNLLIDVKKHNAKSVGDEAFFLAQHFPLQSHVVSKNKKEGIDFLLQKSNLDFIILDDAYHHRELFFYKNILLSDYAAPFYKDWILPVGNLREPRVAYQRADIIIITKCPEHLNKATAEKIKIALGMKPTQYLFFTTIKYEALQHLFSLHFFSLKKPLTQKAILIHGIAQSNCFIDYVKQNFVLVKNLEYPDHYDYQQKDIDYFIRLAKENTDCIFICTEKDAVKLWAYKALSKGFPIYQLPIKLEFLFDEEKNFASLFFK